MFITSTEPPLVWVEACLQVLGFQHPVGERKVAHVSMDEVLTCASREHEDNPLHDHSYMVKMYGYSFIHTFI